MRRHHFMVLVSAAAFAIPSFAADDATAELAGHIFFSACVNSKGDPSSYWVGEYKFLPLPAEQTALFLRGEGQAWSSQLAPGNLVLTVHKSGLCSVHVRRVDTEAMTKEFTWVLNYAWKGKKIEELEPSTASYPYGKSVTRRFLLSELDGTKQQRAVITTSAASDAPLQALLSITNAP